MPRVIPLPDETVKTLKRQYGNPPMVTFLLRMLLKELHPEDDDVSFLNNLEIDHLVLTGDWPEC